MTARLKVSRLVASGFGAGYAPVAPGTAASCAAVLVGAALLAWHPLALPVAVACGVLGGWWAVRASGVTGDPGWVVIDEFAGQWIAMLPLRHPGWAGLLLALLLFRLLDIAKPGPVGWADRRPGALGVMADDVIAGALAAVALWAAQRLLPAWLAL